MEHLWDVLGAIGSAIAGLVVWMFKKHSNRIDEMEKRIAETERTIAVHSAVVSSQLLDIKDDVKEIKEGIKCLVGDK